MKAYPHPPHRTIDFGKLVSDTWRIIWRHKFLWFFGLFAGGGSFFSGGGNFNFSAGTDEKPSSGSQASQADDTGREILDWINAHLTLVIVLAAAVLSLFVLLWLWSIVCRGAVISSVRDVRQDRPISFKSAFTRGRESFGRLLLFDLFLLLLIICLLVIIAAAVMFILFLLLVAGQTGSVILTILGLWLLAFLVFGLGCLACCTIWLVPWIFFGVILNYSTRAVVLEAMRPMAAFRRGWKVMIENLGQTMLMFLVNLGLSIGAGVAILIAVGLSSVPAIIAWILVYSQNWPISLIIVASVLMVIPLTMMLLATAASNTYFSAYWTIGFEKLSGNEPPDGPEHSPGPSNHNTAT
ncbi:MAG: hypothetical protein Q7K29_03585 [Thermoleophilia bacterium]|nr:hypothetical protein [Thermoleophilia bacterium]